jgi:curli production assembly/transport component CsgE
LKKQGAYGILVVLLCFVFSVGAQESQDEKQATSDTQKKLETMVEEVTKKVEEQKKQAGDYALEIDGLIIDETKTKIGRDFYDLFYSLWEAPNDIKNYTIYIYERAHPRFGSWIWITVNETMVYQNVLRPRYDVIEDASRIGINATQQFLYRRSQDQRQLLGQDMSGTGVY